MRVAVACDHAGFSLKKVILNAIQECGNDYIDLGTNNESSVDYPDYAYKAGQIIKTGNADRAIIICGSGIGASIAANKMEGIYAAVCHDTYTAHQGVEHDGMNALCLGARVIGEELAKEIVTAFLNASIDPDARHNRRRQKIKSIEDRTYIDSNE